MRFKLVDKVELDRAADYLAKLAGREAVVDIKRVNYNRSLNQNSFLHLLLQYFASQAGYTLAESKAIYKDVNISLYTYEKNGHSFIRSSADLDTAQMSHSIDRFRTWSAEQGIDLPLAEDKAFMQWASDQIAANMAYL